MTVAKKTSKAVSKTAPKAARSAVLDDMFGLAVVTVGKRALHVRRVLSRDQRKHVEQLQSEIIRIRLELIDLVAADETDMEAVEDVSEQVHTHLTELLTDLVTDTDVPWDDIDMSSLTRILNLVLAAQADFETADIKSTGVPTNAG